MRADGPEPGAARHGDGGRQDAAGDLRAVAALARVADVVSQATTIDEVLRVVARETADLVGVRRCSVHLRDRDTDLFRGRIGWDGERAIDAAVRRTVAGIPADGVTRELLRTREPVIVPNALTDGRMIRSTVRRWRIRSLMAVPMLAGRDVVGILHLDDGDRAHAFTAAEASVASVLARIAAGVVRQLERTLAVRMRADASERQVATLRRAVAVDERLSRLVLSGSSLGDLVRALAEMLGKPCAVHDAAGEPLAIAASDGMAPRLFEPPCATAPEIRAALAAKAGEAAFVLGPLPRAGLLHRHVVAPIVVDGQRWGWLVVMEHGRRFVGGDVLTIRRAATLLALQMTTERCSIEAAWEAGASLTSDVFGGRVEEAVLRRRAERLGITLEAPRVVAFVAPRSERWSARDFRTALGAVRDAGEGATVHATALGGGIAALVGLDGEAGDRALLAAGRTLLASVRAALGTDVVTGLSSVRSGASGYAEAAVEAQEVAECVRRFAPPTSTEIFSADDLGVGRVLLASADQEALCRFAESTFGALVRDPSKADLLATLKLFFDNAASIRRCALLLGVHENTIRYRLARIEELTGLPVVHDPDAQVRARLSTLVLMLQGRLPSMEAAIDRDDATVPAHASRVVLAAG